MPVPIFRKTVVAVVENDILPSPFNTLSALGDVNGDGRPDLIIGGRNGRLVWLENRGRAAPWPMHVMDEPGRMECGGCLTDLTGSGLPDLINGGDWRSDEVWWWQNPGPGGGAWTKRVIARTGRAQFHDARVGDITGDGVTSLVFTNQGGGTSIYRVPLPPDPTVSPWPGLEVIATGLGEPNPRNAHLPDGRQPEEGLTIADLDGDGQNELVCGCHWYKYAGGAWQAHRFAAGYLTTKIAVGDVDGDGRPEIVLSEGDRCIYGWGEEGGRLAWFKPGADISALWAEHPVDAGLLDPHSLQLADLCGSGRLDIFCGEIGYANNAQGEFRPRPPRLSIYENLGEGCFTRHIIDEGPGTHDALLADLDGDGKLDIFGKPLHGPEKWNVHIWFQE